MRLLKWSGLIASCVLSHGVAPRAYAAIHIVGFEQFEKMAAAFDDERIPRSRRVEKFEEMIEAVTEKTNHLGTFATAAEVDRSLPFFELNAILKALPMDSIRERRCNSALSQILAGAGPNVVSAFDLPPVAAFVHANLQKICN